MRLKLLALDQSSMDVNESVHRCLNILDKTQFWCSAGSDTSTSNEWLTFKIPQEIEEEPNIGLNALALKDCALISRFSIMALDAKNDPLLDAQNEYMYAPKEVQIEVGMFPGVYEYKSRVFKVQ